MQIYTEKLRTSQGYLFLILQQFATNLCNFTHFKMLFPAMVMDVVLLDQNFVYSWNRPFHDRAIRHKLEALCINCTSYFASLPGKTRQTLALPNLTKI
jgi:hypothetical protein